MIAAGAPAPSAARTTAGVLFTSALKRAWFGASCSHGRQAANICPDRSCTTVGITRWSCTNRCAKPATSFHQRASWPQAVPSPS
jgi:hypothetical protein